MVSCGRVENTRETWALQLIGRMQYYQLLVFKNQNTAFHNTEEDEFKIYAPLKMYNCH